MILPTIGKMDVVNHFALDHSDQRVLHLQQLIAAERVTVIVQPFALASMARKQTLLMIPIEPAASVNKTEQIRKMNPFLERPERGSLVRQCAQSNRLAIGKNHFQSKHHVGDPTVSSHPVADAALVDHCADDHRRTVGSKVWEHQTALTERMMDRIDTGAALGDHVLHGRIHFENFVHAKHVEQNPALERGTDAHTDAAFGNDGNLVFVGESQNIGDFVIALGLTQSAR